LFDAMSLLILPCPNTGRQSRTTTGPLQRAHLTSPRATDSIRTVKISHQREVHIACARRRGFVGGLCLNVVI
jgi:hypothetical protein